jgi:hypothetical protein
MNSEHPGAVTYDCFLCGRPFKYGPNVYDGRVIPQWEITVCRTCYNSNRDGLVPQSHPRLIRHLEARGTPIKLNEKGWIDWPEK